MSKFPFFHRRHLLVAALLGLLAAAAEAQDFWFNFFPTTTRLGRDGRFYNNFYGDQRLPGGAILTFTGAGTPRVFSEFPRLYASPYFLRGGVNPTGLLSVGQDGALYGTTREGGAFSFGTVFKLEMNGRRTTLHHFQEYGYKGQALSARNGQLYVLDSYGPYFLLRLAPAGSSVRIDLGADYPAELCETAGGEIVLSTYRPAYRQDPVGYLYKVDAADQVQLFATLGSASDHSTAASPRNLLPQADGSIIALTDKIVRVSPDGTVSVLHDFAVPFEGQLPRQVFQGEDGSLIGETATGGLEYSGTVFRFNPANGEYTVLEHLPAPGRREFGGVWLKHYFPYVVEATRGNRPPCARTDFVSDTALRRSTRIDVLRNDSDANRDPLSIVTVGTAQHGAVTFDAEKQQVDYTPNSVQAEYDSFSYTIVDGKGGTAEGRVYIRPDRAGRYQGAVTSVASEESGDPGTLVGSLNVRVNSAGVLAGSIALFERRFAFSGAFNERNIFGTPLVVNQQLGWMTSLQLWLKPVGSGWEIEATVSRLGIPFVARAVVEK